MEMIEKPGTVVFVIDPEFGTDSAQEEQRVMFSEKTKTAKNVICNFSKNNYVSSIGLGLLISLHKNVMKNGGRLVLCSLSPKVLKLFSDTKFTSLFKICDTLDEAVKHLNG